MADLSSPVVFLKSKRSDSPCATSNLGSSRSINELISPSLDRCVCEFACYSPVLISALCNITATPGLPGSPPPGLGGSRLPWTHSRLSQESHCSLRIFCAARASRVLLNLHFESPASGPAMSERSPPGSDHAGIAGQPGSFAWPQDLSIARRSFQNVQSPPNLARSCAMISHRLTTQVLPKSVVTWSLQSSRRLLRRAAMRNPALLLLVHEPPASRDTPPARCDQSQVP